MHPRHPASFRGGGSVGEPHPKLATIRTVALSDAYMYAIVRRAPSRESSAQTVRAPCRGTRTVAYGANTLVSRHPQAFRNHVSVTSHDHYVCKTCNPEAALIAIGRSPNALSAKLSDRVLRSRSIGSSDDTRNRSSSGVLVNAYFFPGNRSNRPYLLYDRSIIG